MEINVFALKSPEHDYNTVEILYNEHILLSIGEAVVTALDCF